MPDTSSLAQEPSGCNERLDEDIIGEQLKAIQEAADRKLQAATEQVLQLQEEIGCLRNKHDQILYQLEAPTNDMVEMTAKRIDGLVTLFSTSVNPLANAFCPDPLRATRQLPFSTDVDAQQPMTEGDYSCRMPPHATNGAEAQRQEPFSFQVMEELFGPEVSSGDHGAAPNPERTESDAISQRSYMGDDTRAVLHEMAQDAHACAEAEALVWECRGVPDLSHMHAAGDSGVEVFQPTPPRKTSVQLAEQCFCRDTGRVS